MRFRRVRVLTATALAAITLSTATAASTQAASIAGARSGLQVAAKATPIDRGKAMSATDRAVIDAGAQAFLANSVDRTPGLWLAAWDPQRGY